MTGRKSKYYLENSNNEKKKMWFVAQYIRLSQEDSNIRRRKARKQ